MYIMSACAPSALRPRYVTQKDLAFFQYHVEEEGELPGSSAWEEMMDKEIPNSVKYRAWRRTLPVRLLRVRLVQLLLLASPTPGGEEPASDCC